ncbi:MAG: heme ABC transporter ATP-binding protein [Pseudomonadota bacterium]
MFDMHEAGLQIGSAWLVRESTLRLRPGELTVIVGPNGAGKSTLLKMMSGEMRPTTGFVLLRGNDLRTLDAAYLAGRRAVLPQSSHLSFPFTVLEVVRMGVLPGYGSHADDNDLALAILDVVDLQGFADRRFQTLSGGEQQRAHLARVLCQIHSSPQEAWDKYVFLDEPVSSLDLKHQVQVMEVARECCRQGTGVLAILHDLNLAALFADRLIMMQDGCCVADGPPHAVITPDRVAEVFGIRALVNTSPPAGRPFVLPDADGKADGSAVDRIA